MQTPAKTSELYPFDHSWTPFQKRVYSYRPEMIILPNWSNRCLRCCVVGHYSNTCPSPTFQKGTYACVAMPWYIATPQCAQMSTQIWKSGHA